MRRFGEQGDGDKRYEAASEALTVALVRRCVTSRVTGGSREYFPDRDLGGSLPNGVAATSTGGAASGDGGPLPARRGSGRSEWRLRAKCVQTGLFGLPRSSPNTLKWMVGATGIEPVTPTMSR
jgi:hypothetical protein